MALKTIGNIMDTDEVIQEKLHDELLNELTNDYLPKKLLNTNDLRDFVNGAIFREVINLSFEINELHSEICNIISELDGKKLLFTKEYTIENLKYYLKSYYIYWSTIRDYIAGAVNKIFDLGIDDKDVKWNLVFRNQHVVETNLPKIIKKYAKSLNVEKMFTMRNDIVHRGILSDSEVINIIYKRNTLYSEKYSLIVENNISDDEFEKKNKELNEEIIQLSIKRHNEIKSHYQLTIDMINEIMKELGKRIKKSYPTIYEK
jgi:hypothetical protein